MSDKEIIEAYKAIIEANNTTIESLQRTIEAQTKTIMQFMGIQIAPQSKPTKKGKS